MFISIARIGGSVMYTTTGIYVSRLCLHVVGQSIVYGLLLLYRYSHILAGVFGENGCWTPEAVST